MSASEWKVFILEIDIRDSQAEQLEELLNQGWHVEHSTAVRDNVYGIVVFILSRERKPQ